MEPLGDGPHSHHAQGQKQQHGSKRQHPAPQLSRQEQRLAGMHAHHEEHETEPDV
jgi:hypothetical protein